MTVSREPLSARHDTSHGASSLQDYSNGETQPAASRQAAVVTDCRVESKWPEAENGVNIVPQIELPLDTVHTVEGKLPASLGIEATHVAAGH